VTFKVIHLLKAFSKEISCTAVQQSANESIATAESVVIVVGPGTFSLLPTPGQHAGKTLSWYALHVVQDLKSLAFGQRTWVPHI